MYAQKLNENNLTKKFNAIAVVKSVVKELSDKTNIQITFMNKNNSDLYYILGDSLKLSQSMTILINNAVDACLLKENIHPSPIVDVTLYADKENLCISVKDNGIGISTLQRNKLFKPQKSTKKNGLGIGLYITKQIIETQFHGKLHISPALNYTEFIITLRPINS